MVRTVGPLWSAIVPRKSRYYAPQDPIDLNIHNYYQLWKVQSVIYKVRTRCWDSNPFLTVLWASYLVGSIRHTGTVGTSQ
ncbi:hypothetical protein G9A89_000475 [Geosiphon pyriformis]|nr:hypothetical protein G9A89_000475 [Geosiphon pyriformis]